MNRPNIQLELGDITRKRADVLVTAANSGLLSGGGVDAAIHRAAGPQLMAACRQIGGCATGSAVLTPAFNLSANGVQAIIHSVGPIWRGGNEREAQLLASAYRTSLQLADEGHFTSIAFPAISSGVYGYPLAAAATIAIQTTDEFLTTAQHLKVVSFVLFNQITIDAFTAALQNMRNK